MECVDKTCHSEINSKQLNNYLYIGDICTVNYGDSIPEKLCDASLPNYPVFGGGKHESGYRNIYNVEPNTILINRSGYYIGYVTKYNTPVFVSTDGFYISNISEAVSPEYLYYYFKCVFEPNAYKIKGELNKIDITKNSLIVPSKEEQQQIVNTLNTCDLKSNLPFIQAHYFREWNKTKYAQLYVN
jgi:restriction endonuclease S subunit